jgi:RING-type zinc-finger
MDTKVPPGNDEETIEHDDLCAVCHALMYRPVTTRCNHTLCESCLNLWAEISINQQMAIVGLDDQPITLHPSELEIKCPMCRTPSTATLDRSREAVLRARYPQTYLMREVEERTAAEDDFADSVETLTLYIGNTHQLIKPDSGGSPNKHNWKFFVRPSRTDLIEEVQIFLVCIEGD